MKPDSVFEALPAFLKKAENIPRGQVYQTIKNSAKKPSAAVQEKVEAERRLAILKK
jgi:hypothetical protein